MYQLAPSRGFRRSIKRLLKSGRFDEDKLYALFSLLREGGPLPVQYSDHALGGEYLGYRECHLKGNLLVMYEIHEARKEIILMNIGSHSELFG